MKLSPVLTIIAVLLLGFAMAGDALAQCNTAAGCGDASCALCAAKAQKLASGGSCSESCSAAAATVVGIPLDQLTPDERKLVNYLADQVQNSNRVEFDADEFSKATGLSEETILGFDEKRIHGGLITELNSRGFDTSKMSFSSGGGNCSDFGACSVDRNLMGASGELLQSYKSEQDTDGKSYLAWKAPDFTLPATDGSEVTLSDYAGKPVAIAILATHCNHCVDTAPMLARLKQKYADELVILPVVANASSVDAVKRWAKSVKVDYPILVSTDKTISEQFKVELVPTIVLVNSKGYVTKKLVTFKDETKLDLALSELIGNVDMGAASGSR